MLISTTKWKTNVKNIIILTYSIVYIFQSLDEFWLFGIFLDCNFWASGFNDFDVFHFKLLPYMGDICKIWKLISDSSKLILSLIFTGRWVRPQYEQPSCWRLYSPSPSHNRSTCLHLCLWPLENHGWIFLHVEPTIWLENSILEFFWLEDSILDIKLLDNLLAFIFNSCT